MRNYPKNLENTKSKLKNNKKFENKGQIVFIKKKTLRKEFMIKTLEKTLKIMNSGGMNKIKDVQNKRSIGGTFYYLVKTSDLINDDLRKKIFWRNTKKKKMKKKLYKSFEKLDINKEKTK